jgi:probable F420-dependent oxidoreductase
MEFWHSAAFAEVDQLVDIGRALEDLGYGGITFSDHLFFPGDLQSPYPDSPSGKPHWTSEVPWPDAFVAAGALAGATSRLKMATQVYVLPMRNPFVVAKSVSTLAALAGGRFVLGCGAGWMKEEFDQLGVNFATRGGRYDEMVEVLRTLWRGGMVEHHGEHFDFGPLEMSPAPPTPVPIYIGGHSRVALDRAARLGDGWMGGTYDEATILATLRSLRELRAANGRADQPFGTIAAMFPTPDVDTCRRLEEAGLSVLVVGPWLAGQAAGREAVESGDAYDSFAAKRAAMEHFSETVIAKLYEQKGNGAPT